MNYNIVAYSVYIPVTLGLSIWTAKVLHRNTKAFLIETFRGKEAVATATNNLLQTGFYLLSIGYAFMRMRIRDNGHWENGQYVSGQLVSLQQMIEELAMKLGGFTLLLGVLLFLNFIVMLMLPKPKVQQPYTSLRVDEPR